MYNSPKKNENGCYVGRAAGAVRRNSTTENTLFIYERTKQGYSIKGGYSVRYFGT